MTTRPKKSEIAIVIAVFATLAVVWAVNGYDDTWLYAIVAIIAIPASWFYSNRKNKE